MAQRNSTGRGATRTATKRPAGQPDAGHSACGRVRHQPAAGGRTAWTAARSRGAPGPPGCASPSWCRPWYAPCAPSSAAATSGVLRAGVVGAYRPAYLGGPVPFGDPARPRPARGLRAARGPRRAGRGRRAGHRRRAAREPRAAAHREPRPGREAGAGRAGAGREADPDRAGAGRAGPGREALAGTEAGAGAEACAGREALAGEKARRPRRSLGRSPQARREPQGRAGRPVDYLARQGRERGRRRLGP